MTGDKSPSVNIRNTPIKMMKTCAITRKNITNSSMYPLILAPAHTRNSKSTD